MPKSTSLWYAEPAKQWDLALPLGNGSMGAMDFGGIHKDVIQFNHINLWLPPSIGDKWVNGSKLPDKTGKVKEVRDLLFKGEAYKAHEIVKK
ncbi:MAG: glycoside hydrolase N-terminal domain-containing protein, partial [Lentisphaeraceae bacterium]|nr:glycoside hydrolase N-terminal domain-containing protein [Lentisphaeraceae bacterium]